MNPRPATSTPVRPALPHLFLPVLALALALFSCAPGPTAASEAPEYPDKFRLLEWRDDEGTAHPVAEAADWPKRRGHILANMEKVMGALPGPERRVPLDVEILETETLPTLLRHKITYAATADYRVPAYLLVPRDLEGPAPAMLCLHGTGGPRGRTAGLGEDYPRYALELAERGYVTIAPDYVLLGDHQIDPGEAGFESGTMMGIWNHLRAVDLLAEMDEVDPERIGCLGLSLGGHNALFVAAFDERLRLAVTSSGFDSFLDYMDGDPSGWCQPRYMMRIEEVYGKDPRRIPFDFPEVVAAIAPRPIHVHAPLRDSNFQIGSVRRCLAAAQGVYELLGAPEALELNDPPGEHGFPPEHRELAYEFVERHIGPSRGLPPGTAGAPAAATPGGPAGQGGTITRLWLTPVSGDPPKVAVSWETDEPGPSLVEYGPTPELGEETALEGERRLHHVEITLPSIDTPWHYRVRSGERASEIASFRFPGGGERLRLAVVANLADRDNGWGEAILREAPDLLLTAGDNIRDLYTDAPVDPGETAAYSRLIDRYPELFRGTLFLPALGNHDKAFRPRGPAPPEEPVYDIEARAFRAFFRLPEPGWRWHFDLPAFGLRLAAADLHHLSDLGNTWQSSHEVAVGSEQHDWFVALAEASDQPFFITLYNERHASVRGLAGGSWWRAIRRGSLAVTGFGHFGERLDDDGFPAFNTSVGGRGTPYPDSRSAVLHSEDNYLLIELERDGPLRAELRDFEGATLEGTRVEVEPRR